MNKLNQQAGQTLLIIIFAITLGLVALVGVSTRIVTSTRRVFIDNAYYKAQAVAEAGAEKFLLKSNADLATLKVGCTTSLYTGDGFNTTELTAHPECVVDLGESRAAVAVEAYPSAGINTYEVNSPANSTILINLLNATSGNDVRVCWQGVNSLGPAYAEILSFYYSKDGSDYLLTQQKHECKGSLSWCGSPPAGYSANDGIEDANVDGDYSCFDVRITDTPQILNLMSLGNGSSYKITFTGAVSSQGYKITSVGEVKSGATGGGSLAGSTATRKKVVVEKSSMPNLGSWFNFAVASESGKIVAE
ncbi:hypothetical protein COT50_03715 [candidate division WWE3 bacterium CG08_land_8_20_14_0_20_41_10]|uniref:Uncharacterized protein n=1 Tax=candidate division WWE3 bacterium CG08_land_8_20_14_0_20_41_10 TaxID=1975085 RepID=A0A2H0XB32_UNCKA|nr:MAG: hypothetical protein COT50_03715 [candidate division WWE3 bacterium CG08_land_8_20_14_0_20_41_10]